MERLGFKKLRALHCGAEWGSIEEAPESGLEAEIQQPSAWGDGWFCHHVENCLGTQLLLLQFYNVPKCMMGSQPMAECGRAPLPSLKPGAAGAALEPLFTCRYQVSEAEGIEGQVEEVV